MQHRRDTRRKRLMQTPFSYSFHATPRQYSHVNPMPWITCDTQRIQINEMCAIQTNPIESRLILSCFWAVAYPGILFGGGVQQIQLRTEDRENGDLGAVAP
jgi:hypothetical protein